MKPTKRNLALLVILLALPAMTGCASTGTKVRDFFFAPQTEEQVTPERVVDVVIYQTNLVHVPEVRDPAGNVLTAAHTIQHVEPVATNAVLVPAQTNMVIVGFTPREEVFGTAQAVATGFPGIGPIVGWIIAGLGSVGAGILNARLKKKEAVAVSTIQAIEAFRKALVQTDSGKALDAKLVEVLVKYQEYAGVRTAVQELLTRHVGPTSAQSLDSLIASILKENGGTGDGKPQS